MRNSKEVTQIDDPVRAEDCEWTPDGDDTWDTNCRKLFTFTDGNVADNGFEFCPFCGRPIAIENEADS